MSVQLTPEHMSAIVQHLQAAYPSEGCGLLVGHYTDGHKTVEQVWPVENARGPEAQHNRYLIPPDTLFKQQRAAERMGLDIVGIFHSHPDHPARPSEFDREHAWPWYSYFVTAVREGKAEETTVWTLRDDRTAFDPEVMRLTVTPTQPESQPMR